MFHTSQTDGHTVYMPWQHIGEARGPMPYAYPPHALLPKILTKIKSEDRMALFIAPAFLQAPWFHTLLKLSIEIDTS